MEIGQQDETMQFTCKWGQFLAMVMRLNNALLGWQELYWNKKIFLFFSSISIHTIKFLFIIEGPEAV